MIMFASQTPEYTYPTNALLLHRMLQGKHRTITQDSNANCAGMVSAVEQTSRYMQANPSIRYALVVGSDYSSVNCNTDDEITYPNFGDAAAAVILERSNEHAGFIDSLYYTDSEGSENIMFPACGLSNIYQEGMTPEQIRIRWTPFDGTVCRRSYSGYERASLTQRSDYGRYLCILSFTILTEKYRAHPNRTRTNRREVHLCRRRVRLYSHKQSFYRLSTRSRGRTNQTWRLCLLLVSWRWLANSYDALSILIV